MMCAYNTPLRCRLSFPCLLFFQFFIVFYRADSMPNPLLSEYQVIHIFPEEGTDSFLSLPTEESPVKRKELTLREIPYSSIVSADLDAGDTDKELSPFLPDAQVSNIIQPEETEELTDLPLKLYDRYRKMGELDLQLGVKSPPRKRIMEIKLELSPVKSINTGSEIAPTTSENQLQTTRGGQWSFSQYESPILFKGHASKRNPEPDPFGGDGNSESGLTLSITSPLEVLREKIRIDNQKFRLKQMNRKNKSNSRYLKDLGR